MAVSETKNLSALKIKFDFDLNLEGKTIVKSRTFSNVKYYTLAQNMLDVANALVNLQQPDLYNLIIFPNKSSIKFIIQ